MARSKSVAQMESELEQGEQQNNGKRIQWSLWDTHKLATGDLEVQLFQVPIGSAGNGFSPKTIVHTNVRSGGTIPKGQQLHVHAIAPYFNTAAVINDATYIAIQQWMRNSLFRIKFPGGDDVIQERIDFIFGEQKMFLHLPTVAGNVIVPSQSYSPAGYYKLNKKLTLAALDTYEIRMDNIVAVPAALNGFDVTWRLIGILKRLSS